MSKLGDVLCGQIVGTLSALQAQDCCPPTYRCAQ